MKGSVGNWTFAQRNGMTIVSQKPTAVSKSSSMKQMRHRVRWANVINTWRAFGGDLKPSFEGSRVSDFNAFVGANLTTNEVYLSKSYAQQGGSVAAPYLITRGSLHAINVSDAGQVKRTDISLGNLEINATTTVADLAYAVLHHNKGFEHGDQISHFRAQQKSDANGVPYVDINATAVVLDLLDETPLTTVAGTMGFASVQGYLGAAQPVQGALAWVHSRKEGGRTLVSTQRFVTTNSVLAAYSSEAALTAAIESYGGTSRSEFLTPDTGNDTTTTVLPPTDGGNSGNTGGSTSGDTMYTLTLINNTPSRGTLSPADTPKQYAAGTEVAVNATATAGNYFTGWADGVNSPSRTVTMNSDTTLTATFAMMGGDDE